jgi:hypothetical protein
VAKMEAEQPSTSSTLEPGPGSNGGEKGDPSPSMGEG